MIHKRIYISADIEGTAGVVTREHLEPKGFEYQSAREWMTAEVNAACEAAFEFGVEEIVISDSHGNGQNLLLDKLPKKNIQIIRSWPRPHCMMEGIQHGKYDAAFFIGYHTGATDMHGCLAHTMSGAAIREIKLNGQTASETVISAATAGHYNVPVAMTSGDDAYAEHVKSVLGDAVETVITKWTISSISARCLLPGEVCERISKQTIAALEKLDTLRPFILQAPIEVDVNFVKRFSAEIFDYLPNVERLDTYRIKFIAKDMIEASKFLSFVIERA